MTLDQNIRDAIVRQRSLPISVDRIKMALYISCAAALHAKKTPVVP